MTKEVISKCPACNGEMTITRLQCEHCSTFMEGEFTGCTFCKLSKENKAFALTFILNRGNIKDIEKELRISYPTVKSKLDSLISELTFIDRPLYTKSEILEKLNQGSINADEAVKMINEMR